MDFGGEIMVIPFYESSAFRRAASVASSGARRGRPPAAGRSSRDRDGKGKPRTDDKAEKAARAGPGRIQAACRRRATGGSLPLGRRRRQPEGPECSGNNQGGRR